MAIQASHRYARISSRKVRPIADLIRGQNVNRAIEILEFSPQRGAFLFKMVVRSALANASQKDGVNLNGLVVDRAYVNDGPLLHRPMGRFVARGRWHPIRKRTSHIHVELRDPEAAASDSAESGGAV